MADHELDMRGAKCPLPLLRTQKLMMNLGVDDTLTLRSTDPMAPIDISEFCDRSGHQLTESSELNGEFTMILLSKTAKNCR